MASTKPCPVCGQEIQSAAKVCRHCGERFKGASQGSGKGDATGGVIPYKNMPALIAYYMAIFSLIPCFPLGIPALILGIIGLRKVSREPEVHGTAHAWIGIILGGICGFGWGLLFLLSFGAAFFAGMR